MKFHFTVRQRMYLSKYEGDIDSCHFEISPKKLEKTFFCFEKQFSKFGIGIGIGKSPKHSDVMVREGKIMYLVKAFKQLSNYFASTQHTASFKHFFFVFVFQFVTCVCVCTLRVRHAAIVFQYVIKSINWKKCKRSARSSIIMRFILTDLTLVRHKNHKT